MAINNPLVPGDPYSYDLNWIVSELKTAIDLYTPIRQEVQDLYDFVHGYFESTTFEGQLDAALRVLAEDGTLSELIQPLFDEYKGDIDAEVADMFNRIGLQNNEIAVLVARMDEFASLPAGSTSGNAELVDIRVAYDGQTWNSAGNAVRGQATELNGRLDVSNFEHPAGTWKKGVLAANGSLTTSLNGVVSDLLTIFDTSVKITDAQATIHFYDEATKYIGKINSQGQIDKVSGDWTWFHDTVQVYDRFPAGAYFYRISVYPNTETVTDAQAYAEANIKIYQRQNYDTAAEYIYRSYVVTGRTWNGVDAYTGSTMRNAIIKPVLAEYDMYIGGSGEHSVSVQYFADSTVASYIKESGWTAMAAVPAGTYFGLAIRNNDNSDVDDSTTEYLIAKRIMQLNESINKVAERLRDIPTTYEAYVIDACLQRKPIHAENEPIGRLAYGQSFAIVDGKYYSTDGAHIAEQDAQFNTLRTADIDVGKGNAMQAGNDNDLYIWGWEDQLVYRVDINTLTVISTIGLPTSGYTTGAIDPQAQIAFIFERATGSDLDNARYNFIAYDYANNQILYRTVTQPFAAIQGVTMFNGLLLVLSGLGTNSIPNNYRVFTRHGDALAEYFFPGVLRFNILEPEGVAFDPLTGIKYVEFANRDVYRFK